MFIAALFIYISQDMETTQVPINRWLAKEDMVHKYNGISLNQKKWNIATCSNMDEPGEYKHSVKTDTETHTLWYHFYVESKTIKQNESIYKTDSET